MNSQKIKSALVYCAFLIILSVVNFLSIAQLLHTKAPYSERTIGRLFSYLVANYGILALTVCVLVAVFCAFWLPSLAMQIAARLKKLVRFDRKK